MNIFVEMINAKKIAGKAELKKVYRQLAKKIHYDLTQDKKNDEKFIKLKAEYEYALQIIEESGEQKKNGKIVNDEELIECFVELIESNFPIDIRIKSSNTAYLKRLDEMKRLLKQRKIEGIDDFQVVENEFYIIRGENIIDNKIFGMIRLILMNIASYYYDPKERTKKAIMKWHLSIANELDNIKCSKAKAFVSWIISNI